MGKYVVIYTGGGGMAAAPAEREKIMAEWGAWYGQMGAAIVDGGAPFGQVKHIAEAGSVKDGALGNKPATGYTVISADNIGAAAAACKNHPHIKHGGQVQVFEAIDMSGGG